MPADRCADAVAVYNKARDDAMRAKREIWHDKYGANGAIYGGGPKRDGLVFDTFAAFKAQHDLGGFCQGERLKGEGGTRWLGKPARNTKRGKQIAVDLDHVAELCNVWQWALEKALGVDGTVLYGRGFHKTVARILSDGRVIVSAAQDLNTPRGPHVSRSFDASTIPEWAQPISRDEYECLSKGSV